MLALICSIASWIDFQSSEVYHPSTGPWFNIKMSYQYRKSHCGDKTVLRPSYLHTGISYTGNQGPGPVFIWDPYLVITMPADVPVIQGCTMWETVGTQAKLNDPSNFQISIFNLKFSSQYILQIVGLFMVDVSTEWYNLHNKMIQINIRGDYER